LSILDDGDAIEDALLQSFIDAAWKYCCRYTRRDLSDEFGSEVPADLLLAQKLVAAHFFQHREATAAGNIQEVPLGVRDLLADFRDMS
jgi:uncharacterized phage protein (predicted DNA packaging)